MYYNLQGSFSGHTEGYVIGNKRHRMFMYSFFFIFELLYSLSILS